MRPPTFFLLLRGCAFSQLLIHNFWLYLIDDSIKLLEKAFERIPLDKGLSSLYQYCAELMTSSNRIDDAIKLLEKAIERIPPDEGLSSLFHYCAELMTSSNRIDDAIKLLEKSIEKIPPDLIREHEPREGQDRNNPMVWFKAYLNLHTGQISKAKDLVALYAPKDFDPTRPLDAAELLRLWSITYKNGSLAQLPGLFEADPKSLQSAMRRSNSCVGRSNQLPNVRSHLFLCYPHKPVPCSSAMLTLTIRIQIRKNAGWIDLSSFLSLWFAKRTSRWVPIRKSKSAKTGMRTSKCTLRMRKQLFCS